MWELLNLDHRFFERYRYAVVDSGRRDELPDSWSFVPIAPTFLGSDTSRCPLLLDCLAIPEVERYTLLDRLEAETLAKEESFVSLALASSASFKSLQRHLAERMVIRDIADNLLRQFRYYDPGTFVQLPDALGSSGMSWLLGPIGSIAVPWLGEWCCLCHPGAQSGGRFDIGQFAGVLQAFSVVNRVLTQLPDVSDQADWRRKGSATRRIVDHARTTYGLDQRDDLVVFALHAWRWHLTFDRHPKIQKLLVELAEASPEDELDYREMTARLEEADWEKIASDLHAGAIQEGKTQ